MIEIVLHLERVQAFLNRLAIKLARLADRLDPKARERAGG